MLKRLFKEIIVSISMGLPLVFAYQSGGAVELNEAVKVLLANDSAANYALFLFSMYAAVAFLEWYLYQPNESSKQRWAFIRSTLSEIGNGLLTVFRIATGVLFVFICIWAWNEPETINAEQIITFIIIGLITCSLSGIFSYVHECIRRLEPKNG